MKKIGFAFLFLISASLLSAQSNISTISGMLPQLPGALGPLGGLKVECIDGCAGGGGGGGDVNIAEVGGVAIGATVPVSGTFWQATQPVSGPLTDAQLRAVAVPVSGTFWQATQPISAAALPLPAGAATEARQSSSSVLSGSLAATTTAAAIGAGAISKVVVQNDPDNAVDILCGNNLTQDVQLRPGDALSMEITNLNLLFCKSASGTADVRYIAR